MSAKEAAPLARSAAQSQIAAKVTDDPIVPEQVTVGEQRRAGLPEAPRSVVEIDLLALSVRERQIWDSAWLSGLIAGIATGRRQVEDEAEQSWRSMAESVRRLGGPLSRPYSAMCALRGEGDTDRAEAARAVERALGVSA